MSTTTTNRIDVSDEDYQDLAAQLRGDVIRPEDAGYDEKARAVHNGSIDRRPGAIARPADVADVNHGPIRPGPGGRCPPRVGARRRPQRRGPRRHLMPGSGHRHVVDAGDPLWDRKAQTVRFEGGCTRSGAIAHPM